MVVGSSDSTARPGVSLERYKLKPCPKYVNKAQNERVPSTAQGNITRGWGCKEHTVLWVPLGIVQIPLCIAVEREGETSTWAETQDFLFLPLEFYFSDQLG